MPDLYISPPKYIFELINTVSQKGYSKSQPCLSEANVQNEPEVKAAICILMDSIWYLVLGNNP